MVRIIDSEGEEATRALGYILGEKAAAGEVYCLDGELGTGKTVFAQGFACGLGIKEPVASPTFTIMQLYESGRVPFCHMDVYRLEDEDELAEIGGEEYLGGDAVCLVEWGSLVRGLLPSDTVFITLEKDLSRGTDYRRITLRREEE